MDRKLRLIIGIIGIVVGLTLIFYHPSIQDNNKTVIINGNEINVELAETETERQVGLMFRETLGENDGMLFIFEQEHPIAFWMKNTLIPLDIIFIDNDLKIVDIKHDVQPCEEDPCPNYTSKSPAIYVLEVNGGYSDLNDIKIGDTIGLKL